MSGRLASQHCEEVEWAYYWDWELVVPVIMLVLESLHSDIVAVVVVEQEVKVVEQILVEAAECSVETEDKDGWAQGQVELEGSLGYALLSILEAKDVGTVQTGFSNLVISTIVVFDNRVELEVVDPSMQVSSQATMASQVHKRTPQYPHSYRWLTNWEMMDIFQLSGPPCRSHKLKCYPMGISLRNASSYILGSICSLMHFPPPISF